MLMALLLFAQEAPAAEPAGGQPPWGPFIPLVAIVLIFYLFIIRPQTQREKKQREMIATTLRKNVEVVTSGGIIGVVWSIKENGDEVTLKIDDNAKIRVLKSSIVRITSQEPPKE